MLRAEAEQRVVLVAGLPVHHYNATDAVAQAYAMVLLVDGGYATQAEVATAFGCSERTVRRNRDRYAVGGMEALAARSGWRSGRRRVATKRVCLIKQLNAEGVSNREIARRLGVTENAIRKQVGSATGVSRQVPMPLAERCSQSDTPIVPPATCAQLPTPTCSRMPATAFKPADPVSSTSDVNSDELQPLPMSLDVDPTNRTWDRLLACLGLLDDAAPIFGNANAVPGAGVLCAIPVLVASGVFRIANDVYGPIGPAFYGLRTTILTLLLMTLWRIKRPEALKEHDPQVLGRVLGLDRAPEIKTVRRKLTRLANCHKAEQFGAELSRFRVAERGQLMGFLYVDGHVRAYHGKQVIPKTYLARVRMAMPATTDYWINDQSGDPLFVMTASVNAGVVKILPNVLSEVRKMVGDRRVTVVFDRGGWSPKLFKQLLDSNFDILTYRKGKSRGIGVHRFVLRQGRFDGHSVDYRLHDQPVRFLKGKLRLRQITRLTDTGHQTRVITSRWDMADIEVAYRMFERWRQENFFKYMREEFLLDALNDYRVEPDDPTRTVPNPQRRLLNNQILALRSQVAKLEQAYGAAAASNPEDRRPTMRGFKIAHAALGKELRSARQQLAELQARRRALPQRVQVHDVSDGATVKLATERKHLTNLIKMLAFQTESDLLIFLTPHYARRQDEGRTLLHELFRAAGDISVQNDELRIMLHPLSSPHRTVAVQALCEILNATATTFPGSHLLIHFAIRPPPTIGLAFPGPRHSPAPEPDISSKG